VAEKVLTTIKLQADGGEGSPAQPVGPGLVQHGINLMEFC
jgi:large subunit ribosomal protein L11